MDDSKLICRRRAFWLFIATLIVGAATWIYMETVGDAADRLRRRAVNDRLSARCAALVAGADSLRAAGDRMTADAARIGEDYILAARLLDEARLTSAKAVPPLPLPVSPAMTDSLNRRLAAARTVLARQLGLVADMPSASAPLIARIAKIDSILNINEHKH